MEGAYKDVLEMCESSGSMEVAILLSYWFWWRVYLRKASHEAASVRRES